MFKFKFILAMILLCASFEAHGVVKPRRLSEFERWIMTGFKNDKPMALMIIEHISHYNVNRQKLQPLLNIRPMDEEYPYVFQWLMNKPDVSQHPQFKFCNDYPSMCQDRFDTAEHYAGVAYGMFFVGRTKIQ